MRQLLAAVALMLLVGCIGTASEAPEVSEMTGKKILMVIAPQDFRDEELFHTREALEAAGAGITIASKTAGTITGVMGGTANAEVALADVSVAEYDAVVFVGGPGSEVYFTDSEALSIAQQASSANKVVAAICIAPGILAHAGLLDGKRATVWNGKYTELIESKGATYTGEPVTVDGKIITANGPGAARGFGAAIAEALA